MCHSMIEKNNFMAESRIGNREIFMMLFLVIFIFQDALQKNIGLFQYLDEGLTAVLFALFLIKVVQTGKIELGSIWILFWIFLMIFIGLMGNVIYNQQAKRAILLDITLCFKFAVVYISAAALFENWDKTCLRLLGKRMVEIITFFLSMIAAADMLFHIFPTPDVRYGLLSHQLFFSHPTYYAACLIGLSVLYLLCIEQLQKKNVVVLAILSVLTLTSLRSKAIASIMVMWILILIISFRKRIRIWFVAASGIASFILARKQIFYYLIDNDDFARSKLLAKGIEIAKEYCPIGAGFASYATHASGVYYSDIYMRFHLNHVWGLEKKNFMFLSDCFWPAILGQFGFLGLIIFLVLLVFVFAYMLSKAKTELRRGVVYFSIAYLLILSIAESSFFNPNSVVLFFILAVFI